MGSGMYEGGKSKKLKKRGASPSTFAFPPLKWPGMTSKQKKGRRPAAISEEMLGGKKLKQKELRMINSETNTRKCKGRGAGLQPQTVAAT